MSIQRLAKKRPKSDRNKVEVVGLAKKGSPAPKAAQKVAVETNNKNNVVNHDGDGTGGGDGLITGREAVTIVLVQWLEECQRLANGKPKWQWH